MKTKLIRSVLAAAVGVAALRSGESSKSPFSRRCFFGDSLTDVASCRPLLIQMVVERLPPSASSPPVQAGLGCTSPINTAAIAQAAWIGNATASPCRSPAATTGPWAVRRYRAISGGLGYAPLADGAIQT